MSVFKTIVISQSAYILATAIWPLVHVSSFMEVTGYKTDVWLVKTVAALLIPVSVSLITYLFFGTDKRPAIALGALTAIAFACIDFYYSLADVISDIYMADGLVQILFLFAWGYFCAKYRQVDVTKMQRLKG